MEEEKKKRETILDSGAFSAWTTGTTIDIDEYITFIQMYKKYFDVIVNLDVIPGEFGRIPTEGEVEESAKKGYENLKYMESKLPDMKIMPVFHHGERLCWLERLIMEGYDYIGISPANDRTTAQKIEWLNEVFEVVCDEEGVPRVKTHSFGATSLEILSRFPFYSADSTTWSRAGRYGSLYIPAFVSSDSSPSYMQSPNIICISEQALDKKNVIDRTARHFDYLSESEKEQVIKYIEGKGGNMERLRKSWRDRDRMNALFFLEVEKELSKKDMKFKRKLKMKGFF